MHSEFRNRRKGAMLSAKARDAFHINANEENTREC